MEGKASTQIIDVGMENGMAYATNGLCVAWENIMVDELCVLCSDGLETVSHLFIHCLVASRLWHGLLGVRTSCFHISSYVDFIVSWIHRFKDYGKYELLKMLIMFDVTWTTRNKVRFEGIVADPSYGHGNA